MTSLVDLAATLGRDLPAQDVRRLAEALRSGPAALHQVTAAAAGAAVRAAYRRVVDQRLSDADRHFLAGALLGHLTPRTPTGRIDVVWTGPDSGAATGRLTSAVVVDLIDRAVTDVLLVGYAVYTEPNVASALHRAADRSVTITLLIERAIDNPRFTGAGTAFPGLDAIRLHWPQAERPAGASLHAKILVIDSDIALVGSANITGAALGHNLECGLLVTGGPIPVEVRKHVTLLLGRGVLTPITA
jgi:cardiolipin synthase A/B